MSRDRHAVTSRHAPLRPHRDEIMRRRILFQNIKIKSRRGYFLWKWVTGAAALSLRRCGHAHA